MAHEYSLLGCSANCVLVYGAKNTGRKDVIRRIFGLEEICGSEPASLGPISAQGVVRHTLWTKYYNAELSIVWATPAEVVPCPDPARELLRRFHAVLLVYNPQKAESFSTLKSFLAGWGSALSADVCLCVSYSRGERTRQPQVAISEAQELCLDHGFEHVRVEKEGGCLSPDLGEEGIPRLQQALQATLWPEHTRIPSSSLSACEYRQLASDDEEDEAVSEKEDCEHPVPGLEEAVKEEGKERLPEKPRAVVLVTCGASSAGPPLAA
eukprot:RCo040250